MSIKRRLMALVLTLAMALSLLPIMAFAAEGDATVKISTSIGQKSGVDPSSNLATVTVGIEVTAGTTTTNPAIEDALSSLKVELFKDGGSTAVETKTATDVTALTASNTYDFALSESGTYTAKVTPEYNSGYAAAADTSLTTASGYTYTAPAQNVALTASVTGLAQTANQEEITGTLTIKDASAQKTSADIAAAIDTSKVTVALDNADNKAVTVTVDTANTETANQVSYPITITVPTAIETIDTNTNLTFTVPLASNASGFDAITGPTGKLGVAYTKPVQGGGTGAILNISDYTITITRDRSTLNVAFTVWAPDVALTTADVVTGATVNVLSLGDLTVENLNKTVIDGKVTCTGTIPTTADIRALEGNVSAMLKVAVGDNYSLANSNPDGEGGTLVLGIAIGFDASLTAGTDCQILTLTISDTEWAKVKDADDAVTVTFTATGAQTPAATCSLAKGGATGIVANQKSYTLVPDVLPNDPGTYAVTVTLKAATDANKDTTVRTTADYVVSGGPVVTPVSVSDVTYNASTGTVTWNTDGDDNAMFHVAAFKGTAMVRGQGKVAQFHTRLEDGSTNLPYTVTTSNGIMTCTCTYRPTLEPGTYTIKVESTTGASAGSAAFTVGDAEEINPNTNTVAAELDKAAGTVTPSTTTNEVRTIITNAVNTATPGTTVTAGNLADVAVETYTARTVYQKIETINENRNVTVVTAGNQKEEIEEATKAWVAANAESNKTVTITQEKVGTPNGIVGLPAGVSASKIATISIEVRIGSSVKTTFGVPFPVSLPIPSDFSSSERDLRVLHYINGTDQAPVDVSFKKVGGNLVFVVDHLSNFVMVDTTRSGGGSRPSSRPSSGGSSSKNNKAPINTTPTPSTGDTVSSGFSDVSSGYTFYKEISWAARKGIMNGIGGGKFNPHGNVNRQQIWMVLARMAGASPANMAEAKTWAMENGISDGTNPTKPVSRQQLVTMLYRYATARNLVPGGATDISTYPDNGSVSNYAKGAIAWAVGNGIVAGTSDGKLNPLGTASRAHFAAFAYRFDQKAGA